MVFRRMESDDEEDDDNVIKKKLMSLQNVVTIQIS